MDFRKYCLGTLIGLNALSVGLSIESILHPLADEIFSYIHFCAISLFWLLRKNRSGLVLVFLLGLATFLPSRLICLRCASLILLFEPLLLSDSTGGHVCRLAVRVLPLTAWTALVLFCLLWTLVLLTNVFFELGDSKTWIFVKPWQAATPFDFFNVTKYFGSTSDAFLTFLQMVTLDHHLSRITRPVTNQYPSLFLFFTSVVVIGALGILNVLLGLVVRETILLSNARTRALHRDKDKESIYLQLAAQACVLRLKHLETRIEAMEPRDRLSSVLIGYHNRAVFLLMLCVGCDWSGCWESQPRPLWSVLSDRRGLMSS